MNERSPASMHALRRRDARVARALDVIVTFGVLGALFYIVLFV